MAARDETTLRIPNLVVIERLKCRIHHVNKVFPLKAQKNATPIQGEAYIGTGRPYVHRYLVLLRWRRLLKIMYNSGVCTPAACVELDMGLGGLRHGFSHTAEIESAPRQNRSICYVCSSSNILNFILTLCHYHYYDPAM